METILLKHKIKVANHFVYKLINDPIHIIESSDAI